MDLILHLGAHRTGSTAVDECLRANAGPLAAEGTGLWLPRQLRRLPGFDALGGHGGAYLDGNAGAIAAVASVRERLGVAWRAEAVEGRKRLLLSEENILGSMRANLRGASFYRTLAARLAVYLAALPVKPLRIGLGLRDYASWWRSSYLACLRRHALPPFAERAPYLARHSRDWVSVVRDLTTACPEAEILVWRQEDLEGRVGAVAAELIGRTDVPPLVQPEGRVNSSGDPADAALILRLRETQPDLKGRALQQALRDLKAGGVTGIAEDFSEADRGLMAARYAADLKIIAGLGGRVRLWSPAPAGGAA